MAERRMFTEKITDSDAFLDMPSSSQCLYFQLNMKADDDGFVNNPKKIVRSINVSEDDLKLLLMKRFIIGFESGVIVIKHWRMHNYIRKDRYNATVYQEELALLDIKDNGSYTLKTNDVNQLSTSCKPVVNRLDKQVRLGKVSIGKDSNNIAKKLVLGQFKNVKLTQDEYDRLKKEQSDIDSIIDWFSAYIVEKGYKSKSHNLTIRRWVIDAYRKDNKRVEPIPDYTSDKKMTKEEYEELKERLKNI